LRKMQAFGGVGHASGLKNRHKHFKIV